MSLLLLFNGNQPLIRYVAGNYFPAGLVTPNAYDATDFDTTTDLSGVPDMTAAVQAAINLCQASAQGGRVVLPPGVVRINGVTISGGGVTLCGAGWEEYQGAYNTNTPAKRGKRGTYVLTDSLTNPTITITNTANNVRIEDLAFIQTHAPDASFAAPRAFKPSIVINGPNSGALVCQRLLFWGCRHGISLGGNAQSVARITLRDITCATFTTGVLATLPNNMLTIDNVGIHPELLAGSPNQQAFIQANGTGVLLDGAQNPMVSNFTANNIAFGIVTQQTSGGQCIVKMTGLDMNGVTTGVSSLGASDQLHINGYNYLGVSSAVSLALQALGSSYAIDLANFYFQTSQGSLISAGGSGGGSVVLGMPASVFNWDTAATGTTAALHASGPNSISYPSLIRFGGAHGTVLADGAFAAYGTTAVKRATYVPVVTATAGVFTTVAATGLWEQNGGTVTWQVVITVTAVGTASGKVRVTLPVNAIGKSAVPGVEETTGKAVIADISGAIGTADIAFYDGTFPGASGNVIVVTGSYEA